MRRIRARALAALWALVLGSPPPAAEGRAIVVALATTPSTSSTIREVRHPSLEALARSVGARDATTLESLLGAAAPEAFRGAAAPPGAFRLDASRIVRIVVPDSADLDRAMATLARDPNVAWAEPDHLREHAGVSWSDRGPGTPASADPPLNPSDPFLRDGRQWGLDNGAIAYAGTPGADVRARAAWGTSTGDHAVILAIADTGIDPGHPELAATLADGSSRLLRGANFGDAGGTIHDRYGHGTPVAGVMAALTGRGGVADSLGVAGVCGGDGGANAGCRVLPIKITAGNTGLASSFAIAAAILHATRSGARAINLSFAGGGASELERLALLEAITHGCVLVAASGNQGFRSGTTPQYPAAYAAQGLCIQVGASDSFDRRAPFSSYGPGLDLVAPGLDVWTTFMTYPSAAGAVRNGYVAASGTSFAAPFVTGAIGLLAALRPELRDVDFQHLLRETSDDVGEPGRDEQTGFGRLNLAAALHAVRPEVGIWHDEVAATAVRVVRADTLRTVEPGPGGFMHAGLREYAELLEVTATVALPDSFVDSIRVWPRLAGTSTVRGDFTLPHWVPWAEVARVEPRRFTLRGHVYRPVGAGDAEALPLPLDQARFGFTVLGRVARVARREASDGARAAEPRAGLRVRPNPFVAGTRIELATPARLTVHDVHGRIVRTLDASSGGGAWWDGADDGGRVLPAGLYWIRPRGGMGRATRVLKLR